MTAVTRLPAGSDPGDTLDPVVVIEYEFDEDPGTVVHRVLNSSTVHVMHAPFQLRRGTFRFVFQHHADVQIAREFFRVSPAVFELTEDAFSTPSTLEGGTVPITMLDTQFVVVSTARPRWNADDEVWTFDIGYHEVNA